MYLLLVTGFPLSWGDRFLVTSTRLGSLPALRESVVRTCSYTNLKPFEQVRYFGSGGSSQQGLSIFRTKAVSNPPFGTHDRWSIGKSYLIRLTPLITSTSEKLNIIWWWHAIHNVRYPHPRFHNVDYWAKPIVEKELSDGRSQLHSLSLFSTAHQGCFSNSNLIKIFPVVFSLNPGQWTGQDYNLMIW